MVNKQLREINIIAFVAHEFGLYPGHGGIASYLYNICKWILENMPNIEIHVLAYNYDTQCDLLNNKNLIFHKLSGSLAEVRQEVYKYLSKIRPQYAEFADFLAYGLDCVKAKVYKGEFQDCVFTTNNHTGSRECYEWSNMQNIDEAPFFIKEEFINESLQLKLSDYCLAPSSFLANYVKRNYHLNNNVLVFANPYVTVLKTKKQIKEEMEEYYDIDNYNEMFNILLISRFEVRKHQDKLIKAVQNLQDKGLKIRLILAGNTTPWGKYPDYREYLYNNTVKNDNVIFYDFLPLKEQGKLAVIADLTVMPSIFENQPVAMVEMVLRGIPVMGSIYSGIKDYTKTNNLLFDPFKEGDLEAKIENFVKLSKEEKENLQKEQYNDLQAFINPKKSILGRLNLPLRENLSGNNYEKIMEEFVK